MEVVKGKWRRNLFLQAWKRCQSVNIVGTKKSVLDHLSLPKSKSWHCSRRKTQSSNQEDDDNNQRKKNKKSQVAPDGCFSVYVGPEKQRFVVKAKLANHPLFKMLLEDAESEYGFNSDGPILLPCDVDLFYKVLAEMEHGDGDGDGGGGDDIINLPTCSSLMLCSPSRRPNSCNKNKGYGAYRLLSPSRMLKLNQY